MGKENSILTVDIGNRSLKMAEFFFQDGGMLLTKFLSRRIELAEEETVVQWFERNYNEMLLEGGFTAESVRLALPSSSSFQRLSKLPPMLGSSATVAKLIEFEAAQAVPYAMHEVEWGYQLLHHTWQEQVEETDEDGNVSKVTVDNEEYEALFVAVKTEDVVCYTDVIENSGKKILSVELASLNLFNAAVVSQIAEGECVMLLDIGAKGSCLMIADNRRIFMRNIPIGGDTVNFQISKEFGVADREAEELKRRHGFVALGGAYDEPDSSLASTISKIARNVMTRLHGEISRSINLWRAQHGGNAPVRMLLSGGGATMQYTTEFFHEKLRIPVEYLNTFSLITIGQGVDRNALQASASMAQSMIGMALHSLGNCPVDISLLPRVIRRQYELNARKPYFYASAIALISCLFISVIALGRVRDFEMDRVREVEKRVEAAERDASRVRSVQGQLDSLRNSFSESAQFLDARNKYAAVLSELQRMIPDRMWLVLLEPYVEEESESYGMDDMGGMAVRSDSPEKKNDGSMTAEKFNSITEVKMLRLKGYYLRFSTDEEQDRNLFNEFERKITESEMFERIAIRENSDGINNNLSYFEVILTLKDALKK